RQVSSPVGVHDIAPRPPLGLGTGRAAGDAVVLTACRLDVDRLPRLRTLREGAPRSGGADRCRGSARGGQKLVTGRIGCSPPRSEAPTCPPAHRDARRALRDVRPAAAISATRYGEAC